MTDPSVIQLDTGLLTIGETGSLHQLGHQVTECILVPKVSKKDQIKVLSGGSVPGSRSTTYTLKGKLLQDFGRATPVESVSEFLFTSDGLMLPFVFDPDENSTKKVTGTLVVEATAIGGKVGDNAEADFEFDVIGKPAISAKA